MKFSFAHNNINVKDLDKSLAFYKEALLLEEARRLEDPSGAFILVYLKSPYTAHQDGFRLYLYTQKPVPLHAVSECL